MNKKHISVIWQGCRYFCINRFDGRIVDLRLLKDGGGYFTALPISPKEYRLSNPTKAKVIISEGEFRTVFTIYDDWGEKHIMEIPRSMVKEIEEAKEGIIRLGL